MSLAFSAKNLNEYEPCMAKHVEKLMGCLRRHAGASKEFRIDFNEYCELARQLFNQGIEIIY